MITLRFILIVFVMAIIVISSSCGRHVFHVGQGIALISKIDELMFAKGLLGELLPQFLRYSNENEYT